MLKALSLLAVAAVMLAVAGTAEAATPAAATTTITACLKHKPPGAVKVKPRKSKWGGTAYFRHPYRAHYLRWTYLVWDGQVLGTVETWWGLTKRERRAVTRCMRPFNPA